MPQADLFAGGPEPSPAPAARKRRSKKAAPPPDPPVDSLPAVIEPDPPADEPPRRRVEVQSLPLPQKLYFHGVKNEQLARTRVSLDKARVDYEKACSDVACTHCRRPLASALDRSRLGEVVASLTKSVRELLESLEGTADPAKVGTSLDTILEQFGENIVRDLGGELDHLAGLCAAVDPKNATRHRANAIEAFKRFGKQFQEEYDAVRKALVGLTGADGVGHRAGRRKRGR